MNTLMLCLCMAQMAPSQTEGVGSGAAFFKVVNVSDNRIIAHISDTDEKFSQVITLKAGEHQWVAVKQGTYKCGLANKEMKTCGISAGQIIQIDLPWGVKGDDKTTTQSKEKPVKVAVEKKDPVPKDEGPPVAKKEVVKEPEKKKPERPPIITATTTKEEEKVVEKKVEKPVEPSITATQALVEINGVPADGRMWIDDAKVTQITQRWYKTPDKLVPGMHYFYVIRAEVDRNGYTYVDSRKVFVFAGRKSVVNLNLPK